MIVDKSAEAEESISLFHGKTIALTSNPSWNGLDFNCDAFIKYPDLNGILYCSFFPDDSIELQIQILDNSTENSSTDVVYELSIDVKRMVWLPAIDITTLSALPMNTIFFIIEDGGVMMDEKLYVILRSNSILSVSSKQNRIEVNDDVDNDSQEEEQAVSHSSCLDSPNTEGQRIFEKDYRSQAIYSNYLTRNNPGTTPISWSDLQKQASSATPNIQDAEIKVRIIIRRKTFAI